MSDQRTQNTASVFSAAILAASIGLNAAQAAENPFTSTVVSDYQVQIAEGEGKCGEGKCGEGKCGSGDDETSSEVEPTDSNTKPSDAMKDKMLQDEPSGDA